MARKNQHTFSKRQREQKKAEKAAQKRARRKDRANPAPPPSTAAEGLPPAGEGGVSTPV